MYTEVKSGNPFPNGAVCEYHRFTDEENEKAWKNTRSSMERKIKKTGNDIDGKRKSVQGVRVKGNLGKEGTGI